jgi:endoglucanase
MKKYAILALVVLAVAVAVCPARAILGDVNGDGKVDMKDVAIVAKAFGTTPSDPRYNPAADLNGDRLVNMVDIAIVGFNLGK